MKSIATPDYIMKAIEQLKTKNPNLKILIGVDGLDSLTRLGSQWEILMMLYSLAYQVSGTLIDGIQVNIKSVEKTNGLILSLIQSFREMLRNFNNFTIGINYEKVIEGKL